jgi:death-on-curing protein
VEWIWIGRDAALQIHANQLTEHGGGEGVRDLGAIESALSRPLNLVAYGAPDVASLAAAYAFGIARNHPFVDGNKRTAAVVSVTFVLANGFKFEATPADVAVAFLALAAGELSEDELAEWFRRHIVTP